jgi:hypothetical protein
MVKHAKLCCGHKKRSNAIFRPLLLAHHYFKQFKLPICDQQPSRLKNHVLPRPSLSDVQSASKQEPQLRSSQFCMRKQLSTQ